MMFCSKKNFSQILTKRGDPYEKNHNFFLLKEIPQLTHLLKALIGLLQNILFTIFKKGHFEKSGFRSKKIRIAHICLFLNLKSNFAGIYLQNWTNRYYF